MHWAHTHPEYTRNQLVNLFTCIAENTKMKRKVGPYWPPHARHLLFYIVCWAAGAQGPAGADREPCLGGSRPPTTGVHLFGGQMGALGVWMAGVSAAAPCVRMQSCRETPPRV